MALESFGTDYHHLESGDVPVPGGLVNVQSATLSGDKETEVYGVNGDGERDALLLGNMKHTGEVTGYASAFEPPATTGALEIAGQTLAKKGFRIDAAVGSFTMATVSGVGGPNIPVP